MVNLIEIGKSGIKVPFLGMGTWAIGGGSWWGDNDDELCQNDSKGDRSWNQMD